MGTVRLSHLPRCEKNSPGCPSPLVDDRLGLLHLCRKTKTILSSLLPAHLTDDGNGALHGSGLEQDVRSDEDMEPNVGGEGGMEPDVGGEGDMPPLKDVHKKVPEYDGAKCVDGEDPQFVYEALRSKYFPWRNLTELLIGVWAVIHRPSRKSLQTLLDLIRFVDREGGRFRPDDVPRSAEHLISRMRKRLPHLPVFERLIKDKEGKPARAMDIPFNLVLQRMLSCPRVVEEWRKNFGGHVMSSGERAENNVPDEHITPVATELADEAYETYMNGELVRSSSHMGLECVTAQDGVRVMVGDTIMARVPGYGTPQPCRLAAMFWRDLRKRDHRDLQLAGGGAGLSERLGFQPGSSSSSDSGDDSRSGNSDSGDDSSSGNSDSGDDSSSGSSDSGDDSSTSRNGRSTSRSSSGSSRSSTSGSRSSSPSSSSSEGSSSSGGASAVHPEARGRRAGRVRLRTSKGQAYAESLAASVAQKGKRRLRGEGADPDGRSSSPENITTSSSEGHLVIRVNRLLARSSVGRAVNPKRRRDEKYEHVWELTNDPLELRARAIMGLCSVLEPGESSEPGKDGAVPAYYGEGFVEQTRRTKKLQVVMTPWRQQGYHGWFFDRRASGVHANLTGLPVFSAGLVCSSDAFNYFSLSGRRFSANATFVGLGCLSPALLRRLRSWYLATLGLPGAAWELDVLPLMKVIRLLQNGCKAEISVGDKQTVTVSFCCAQTGKVHGDFT